MKVSLRSAVPFIVCLFAMTGCKTTGDILNFETGPIEKTVQNSTVKSVNNSLVSTMVRHGYSVNKQSTNFVEFTRAKAGLLTTANSAGGKSTEIVNCALIDRKPNVTISCRSYLDTIYRDRNPSRTEQTSAFGYRSRLERELSSVN